MGDERPSIAALLLVVQAGLNLLAAFGLYAFAKTGGAAAYLAGAEMLAFGGSLALIALALGVLRGWRIARLVVYLFEALTILGNVFSVLASAGSAMSLTLVLSGLALPAAIVYLLLARPNRATDLRKALTVGLLLVTGLIHLALVPAHLAEPPKLGGLFLLDALAFIALAIAAQREWRWWRLPTAVLLLATILAYVVVVISGQEEVDDLGIATKLIELLALGVVIWPRNSLNWRWLLAAACLLGTIVFSGGLAWAATLRPSAAAGHHHHGTSTQLIAAAPPTDAQRAAAVQLIDDTRAGIARFGDVNVALADGYGATTPAAAPTVHYVNPAYERADNILNPSRPQALVYANTRHGVLLLGAMYMMPKSNMAPPDFGGALAEWHTHPNLCFTPPKFALDGIESPFGTCPIGSINGPTPAMLHVWIVPNPAGPFGDLSPAYVARLTSS